MTVPFELEDWLTEAGDQVVRKMAAQGEESLSDREKLIYEIWLLDTEVRNGGLSQYFVNFGMRQWQQCASLAMALPSFTGFAKQVTALLSANADPYLAILARESEASEFYYTHQVVIVTELRKIVENQA